VISVSFSPDDRFLAAGSADKTARVIEAATGREICRVEFGSYLRTVSFSPDGRYLAAGSGDKTVRVFEAETGREISRVEFGSDVTSVCLSPDGRFVAAGSADKTVRVFEAETGREISRVEFGSDVKSVCFSPDGFYLAAGGNDRTLRMIEVATGKEVRSVGFGDSIFSVRFSYDGHFLATGSGDTAARVIEAATGKEVSRFTPDGYGGLTVSFSPDGRYLAAGTWDKTARVMEVATGKEIRRIKFGRSATEVSFSPDGRFLAAAGKDGTVLVIDASWFVMGNASACPPWFAALDMQSGLRFQANGKLLPLSAEDLIEAQNTVKAFISRLPTEDERWQHAILKWSQMLPEVRTTSPWTQETIRVAVGRWLMQARTDTPTIRDCADQAPWHPLTPISLARLEPRPDDRTDATKRESMMIRPTFLARLTLKRLGEVDAKLYGADLLAVYASKAAEWMDELKLHEEAKEARAMR
jgi:DNA-binding beta-propeller fold protein YncE